MPVKDGILPVPNNICTEYCGNVTNNCGQTISCGSCTAPNTCGALVAGQCGCKADPDPCSTLGYECGSAPDGCGKNISCGSCGVSLRCLQHVCECIKIGCQ